MPPVLASAALRRLLAILVSLPPLAVHAAEPADRVFLSAAAYTVDAARSWAQAVAVRGDRIVYVGTDDGARAFIGPATRVEDLSGRLLLPAFHDSHVHPLTSGVELAKCDLNSAANADEVIRRVRDYASAHPHSAWIEGGGWDLPLFPAANPGKRALDSLVPDRPAILWAADGHSAWVNSRALALAGITAATPDPPRGRIERDPATGEPSGTLREEAADLVGDLVPEPSDDERRAGLARAVEILHGFGIVSIQEAHAGESDLRIYRDLDRRGALGLRVVAALGTDAARGAEQVADLERLRAADWGPHVRASAAKIFADGVIESGTAALLEPYLPPLHGRGELNFGAERLTDLVTALDKAGFQIHVHAIGDRAIRSALDALGAARARNAVRDWRPILAHIQLFDPTDIPRFRELGAIADFQPLWAFPDPYIRELTEPILGPARSRWLYPIASVARSGAALAAGSDWSVSSPNPLLGMQVAITRCDPDAAACSPWIPEERVDLATMLAAYTIGGAYANFEERESGSIEVGKKADLVVLDRNLFAIPPQEIGRTRVLATYFEGAEVFRAAAAP
jgi:predicted amidohydrolase YtcJ